MHRLESPPSRQSGRTASRLRRRRRSSLRAARRRPRRQQAREIMDGTELLRAELVRAAQSLGAPDDVEPVIERPRDPAFGDWATNLAMVLAKPLGKKPRDLAQAIIERLDFARAGISAAEIAGPGLHQLPRRGGRVRRGLARADRRGRRRTGARTPGRAQPGQRRVRVGESDRPAARRPRPPGRARRRDLRAARARPAGASRESSTTTTPARRSRISRSACRRACASWAAWTSRFPRAATTASTFAISRSATSTSIRPIRTADDLDAVRQFAVRELRKEQDRDLQAFGVKFDVYFLESSLYADGRVDDTVDALVAAGHTYEKDGALWLQTTDFGDDKDRVMRQERRRRAVSRPTSCPTSRTTSRSGSAASIARSTCRAPTITARSRACASGCRRSTWGFRRAIPSTCCTRW